MHIYVHTHIHKCSINITKSIHFDEFKTDYPCDLQLRFVYTFVTFYLLMQKNRLKC